MTDPKPITKPEVSEIQDMMDQARKKKEREAKVRKEHNDRVSKQNPPPNKKA